MRYQTIVVDPPWHYQSWPGSTMSGVMKGYTAETWVRDPKRRKPIDYPTLQVAEIAALPVGDLADTDAHLYLWTTNRYLPDAFAVLTAWGFRYSQTLVWAKTPMGLGPGGTFAQNAEFCLFARRGHPHHQRRWDSVWFNWPRQGAGHHSQKPDHFYDLVEQVSPSPYVEMFSRRHRMGWDVLGNESANTAQIDGAA